MIPEELRALPQWVTWGDELVDGRRAKVPYTPTGRRASSTDPNTWGTFEEAVRKWWEAVDSASPLRGIGYVLARNDAFVGVDFDDCRLRGHLHPVVAELVAQLDSFTEISPSGNGLHVFVRADLKGHRNRTSKTPWGGEFEAYAHSRYFTITGQHLEGTPGTVEDRQEPLDKILSDLLPAPVVPVPVLTSLAPLNLDDEELLAKARNSKNGVEFSRLYDHGDISGYPSHSEADLGLCRKLAFWAQGDPDRIDRLFRRSGLYRQKWERPGYRNSTISKVLQTRADYRPLRRSS